MPHGFSLLEVLMTVFLISVSLLGFAEAEITAMRELKVLRQYAFLEQNFTSLDETLQTTTQKAVAMNAWRDSLKSTFPAVKITITTKTPGAYLIIIQWSEHHENYHLAQILYE